MDFALNIAINKTSIGKVSTNVAREFYKMGLNPVIFPIHEPDFKSYPADEDFTNWLKKNISRALVEHNRKNPTLKIWHISDHNHLSEKQVLYSFHECDQATPTEVNIVKNTNKVVFPCQYNSEVFKTFGCENVSNLPLGFDSTSFRRLDKKYHPDGVIYMNMGGKLEARKNHHKVLNFWAKKFGNKREYVLNCALFNPFMKPEHQENFIAQSLEGKRYWNINFLPYMEEDSLYNDFLNSADIFIDMSSAESWSLPSFQAVSLGKHAVILNATGMKDWATSNNSVLVNPSGKRPLYDNIFFREGNAFNQGSGFDFSDDAFYSGVESAILRYKANPVNENGLKLQEKFTYKNLAEKLLEELK